MRLDELSVCRVLRDMNVRDADPGFRQRGQRHSRCDACRVKLGGDPVVAGERHLDDLLLEGVFDFLQ